MNIEKDQFYHWVNFLLKSELINDVNFKDFMQDASSKLRKNDEELYNLSESSFNNYIAEYQKDMNGLVSIPKPISKNKPVR